MISTRVKSIYQRNKLLVDNIVGSYLVKGASLLISILTLPAYLRYFPDNSVLGVWLAILSILQWVLTFDLGIGNGLRNKIAPAYIDKDTKTMKSYISSAYVIVGIIAISIIIIGTILILFGDWNLLLKISSVSVSNETLITVIVIVFIGIVLQLFFKLILSVLYAMQKTATSSLISFISPVLILIYILLFRTGDVKTDLISLALINVFAVNVPLVMASLVVFSSLLKESRPNLKYFEKDYATSIIKLGAKFFMVQIAFILIISTDQVVITQLVGPQYVVEFQIYYKIFWLFVTFFVLVTNPVWSAITKANVEKNYLWIQKIYRLLCFIAIAGFICCLVLVVILQFVFDIWLGTESIPVNYMYAIVFSISAGVMMLMLAGATIANGMDKLNAQLICYSIAAILKIPLSCILFYFFQNWICVPIADILVLIPYLIIQPIVIRTSLAKRMKSCVVAQTGGNEND